MIILQNETSYKIKIDLLDAIANELSAKDIELIFTTNDKIQQINREYRNIDKPTDVLSFPLEDMPHSPLGSIIISVDKAHEISEKLGHSFDEEVTLLFIHGLLHLSGYDHEVDDGQMRKQEEDLIKKYKLPKSLIVRNS